MSFRAFVRSVEMAARAAGIALPMARLRDAISRALYNRPYSAACAAEDASRLPPLELPPPYLDQTAEFYGMDRDLFAGAFPGPSAGATPVAADASSRHAILRATSLSALLRHCDRPTTVALRAFLDKLPKHTAPIVNMALGTVAGIAAVIAKFTPELLDAAQLRVAVYCTEAPLVVDAGRILQLAAEWLDARATFEFDVIRDDVSYDNEQLDPRMTTHLLPYLNRLRPARYFRFTGDYRVEHERPQLAIVVYPDWCDDLEQISRSAWLAELLRMRVPVLGLTFDPLQADLVDLVIRGHGLGECELFESAAYAEVALPHSMINYPGRCLFKVVPVAGEPGVVRNGDWLAAAREVSTAFSKGVQQEQEADLVGTLVAEGDRTLVFGTANRAVDLASGDIYVLERRTDEGTLLRRLPPPTRARDWEPLTADDVARPYERVLAVENAFAEALFPPDLIDAGDVSDMLSDPEFREMFAHQLGADGDPESVLEKFTRALTGKSGVEAGIPMFVAIASNDADAVRKLVADGAATDARDHEGWTPLAEAAACNAVEAARALLDLGADPSLPTLMGHSPATIALSRTHDAVALAILQAGADLDFVAGSGYSARMLIEKGFVQSPAILSWYQTHKATNPSG